MKYKYSVLNTARWETETITEWVIYYRSIGFDHIYIYCNDDSPDGLYQTLLPFLNETDPYVTFHWMPYPGWQQYCWTHFLDHHKEETEWFMFVDADEFLAIKGSNSIEQFMIDRQRDCDCINFNWIWFGPQDFIDRPKGSTLLQYTMREDYRKQLNYFTKTLTRSSVIDARAIQRPTQTIINHFWPAEMQNAMRSVNVLGYPISDYNANHPHEANRYLEDIRVREQIFETAITYHYLFRSRRDFVRRVERGLTGDYYNQATWGNVYASGSLEPFVATLNAVEDTYLRSY